MYFAKNKKCLGGVLLSNALKDGAKELVLNLKEQNLKTFILSGDHVKNVEKIAKELQ
ncbi:HAD family hydrolase, partial [Campylobacter jejuni]|uniref:HAD family hydrolase n=1 Tax=Campylobacter jejuni TaxID=197 RepID=UPI001ED9F42A|nr:HAD family hydrolase [Campylobacter jejuni]